jgi:hypothetical protein
VLGVVDRLHLVASAWCWQGCLSLAMEVCVRRKKGAGGSEVVVEK